MSLTPERVAQVAYSAGFRGEGLVMAVAVSGAETAGTYDPALDSPPNVTSGPDNGSIDRGLWQLNSYWHSEVSDTQAHNPDASARAAYRISSGGTNWSAWSTTKGSPPAYKRYLSTARAAAAAVDGGTSTPRDRGTKVRFLQPDDEPAIPIRIGGQIAARELSYALVSAPVEYTTQEASQLTLVFDDNDWLILDRFKLASGPDGTPIEAAGARWRVYSVGTRPGAKGPQTVLVCQTSGVMRLRGFTPSAARHISPTDYVAMQANTAGLRFRGQSTATEPHIGPQKTQDPVTGQKRRENAWEVARRLASDREFLCFESGGTVFFGNPQFLAEYAPTWQPVINGHSDGDDFGTAIDARSWPTVTDLAFGGTPPRRSISIALERDVGQRIRAGDELWLPAVPGLGGRVTATITAVSWDLTRPLDPVTVQASDRSMLSKQISEALNADLVTESAGAVDLGTKSALDFVTLCLRQVGDSYVWGAGRDVTDPDPDAFDCSGLVYWACAQMGVKIGSWSGAQYEDCARAGLLISVERAAATRGALIFRGAHGEDHVVVSLGDGQHTVEARGTAYGVVRGPIAGREWDAAGLIPGLRYS